jgi:hypothetical protein
MEEGGSFSSAARAFIAKKKKKSVRASIGQDEAGGEADSLGVTSSRTEVTPTEGRIRVSLSLLTQYYNYTIA